MSDAPVCPVLRCRRGSPLPANVTRAVRNQTLEAEIRYSESHGWRVREKTPSDAHLVRGEPVAHWVHLFFTIATVGLWLLVWIPLTVLGGEKHRYISVGEDGRVTSSSTTTQAFQPRERLAA
jgi:hypothetical protein